MNTWISAYNIQMANNLMKWWKTKFLNGYKQFSVDCNEGRISDTEELLSRSGEESGLTETTAACTTPPILTPQATASPQDSAPSQHLNLEEFSCDVSVEGGLDKRGQERQEFSFTLYDFDGHGKITKDDIAGLVTTIYEVLGSSVKVPHYGSKTIRVKLTVSPDQRKHVSATVIEQNKEKPAESRVKRDVNVIIRHARQKKKDCNNKATTRQKDKRYHHDHHHHCCNHHEEELDGDDNSTVTESSSNVSIVSDGEEGECSGDENFSRAKQKKAHRTAAAPRYAIPNLFVKKNNIINQQEGCLKFRKAQKRSSSLQRQELLEIIQANMDKNNLSFQTGRKHSTDHISSEDRQVNQSEQKTYRHYRHKSKVSSSSSSSSPLQCLANIVDPTHFYVDLASLQNTTHLPESNCQYNKLINAVMCVSNKRVAAVNRKHNLPASNIPVRYQLLNNRPLNNYDSIVNKNCKKATTKLIESEQNATFKRSTKKLPQVVVGHTSSPHHLRHRNRQEDQARAMAQVVRWLEQEFSSDVHCEDRKEKSKSTSWSNHQEEQTRSSGASATDPAVERHEHHHVHEHIHHHYHHYQETPIVV